MSLYIPVDASPTVPGFSEVSTRIIFGQWIYTDGTPVTPPPMISYLNTPYTIIDARVRMFAASSFPATALDQPTDDAGDPIPNTAGIWYAEVITQDPDLAGDVAVRISHSDLPGGSLTIKVPQGSDPLSIVDAERVA